jgi:hypothetical protein
MKKLLVIAGTLALLIGNAVSDPLCHDMTYLSLTPGGSPVDYVYLDPCEEITLYVVFHNWSASASSINIPIMYDPLVEVVDYGFHDTSWEVLPPGYCGMVWNFFPSHDLDNMYVNWYAWTASYPDCDIPEASYFDVGFITFHCLGEGLTEIVEGSGPTGMGLLYTNGETAIDYYPEWTVLVIEQGGTDVKEGGMHNVPKVPFLASAAPSLFQTSTSIEYGITKDEHVNLSVYDASGRMVRILAKGEMKAGSYTVTWNGRDDLGRQLSSGVYFYKLETEELSASRKVVLH